MSLALSIGTSGSNPAITIHNICTPALYNANVAVVNALVVGFLQVFDEPGVQGDQIGRLFVYWVIVYSKCNFENYRSHPKFWAIFY
jgi:hypothetical protein